MEAPTMGNNLTLSSIASMGFPYPSPLPNNVTSSIAENKVAPIPSNITLHTNNSTSSNNASASIQETRNADTITNETKDNAIYFDDQGSIEGLGDNFKFLNSVNQDVANPMQPNPNAASPLNVLANNFELIQMLKLEECELLRTERQSIVAARGDVILVQKSIIDYGHLCAYL